MSIGALLLYKIVKEQNIKLFEEFDAELLFEKEKDVYKFIFEYFTKTSSLPPFNLLKRKFEYDFNDDDYKIDNNFILQDIKERYSQSLKIKYNSKLKEAKNEFEKDTLLQQMGVELFKFWNKTTNITIVYNDYIKELERKYIEFIEKGSLGIFTGYKTFDEMSGGLLPCEIYLVLGRLKQGKSQLLINIVNNILLQSKKVLFISMEMTKTQIFDRLLGIRLKTNPNVYRLGKISPFAIDKIKSINIQNLLVVEGQFKSTINEIILLATIHSPDVLVIDGAYLIRFESKAYEYMSKPERLEEIMKELKALAHTINIPILASFQLGREANRLGVSKLGKETADKIQWSDSIAQIMTSGLAIYDDKDNPKRKLVEIVRGRHGEDGEFYINWDFDTGNFNEIEETILVQDEIDFNEISE